MKKPGRIMRGWIGRRWRDIVAAVSNPYRPERYYLRGKPSNHPRVGGRARSVKSDSARPSR